MFLLFSTVFSELVFMQDEEQYVPTPYEDAVVDANASAFPMIWGITGFLSSCLLAPVGTILVNLAMLSASQFSSSVNLYTASAVCCLGATLVSYISKPTAPRVGLFGKDMSYAEKYKETYESTLHNKNTMYTFIGGTLGFLVTTLSLYMFVFLLFPIY